MNELQIFQNEEFGRVRTLLVDDTIWFVGKDVAEALGYTNATKAIRDHVVDEDMMMGVQNVTPSIIDSLGRTQYPTWINESGLYSLIMSSKLPKAQEFKHWITSEVIPSIRKHGVYMTPQVIEEILYNPDTIITLATQLKKEREEKLALQKENEVLSPKADYYDNVLQAPDLLSITEIAKEFGMTAYQMNKFLADQHVQYKVNGHWVLYKEFADLGYVKYKTFYEIVDGEKHAFQHAYWTQKGRKFIYSLCEENGIYPVSQVKRSVKA